MNDLERDLELLEGIPNKSEEEQKNCHHVWVWSSPPNDDMQYCEKCGETMEVGWGEEVEKRIKARDGGPMTWDDFKRKVDAELNRLKVTGKIPLGHIQFPAGPDGMRGERFTVEISNKGRGPEERLVIY